MAAAPGDGDYSGLTPIWRPNSPNLESLATRRRVGSNLSDEIKVVLRRLFVCYSRRDARAVVGLVRLMRVTGAAVFRDEDSIAPGQRWRAEVSDALGAADTVLVFWSTHARASEEVRHEYETAMAAGKTVIPILLDGTPPAEALQQFQHLDFSELFVPRSPEGLSRSSHHLIQGLLVRLFPEVEPVCFVKPAASPNMD